MLEFFEAKVSPKIFQRGKKYYLENRVKDYRLSQLSDNKFLIDAVIVGSKNYFVRIGLKFDHDVLRYEGECICPYDWDWICKHQVAAMFHFFVHDYPRIFNGQQLYLGYEQLLEVVDAPQQKPVSFTYKVKGLLSERMVNFSFTLEFPENIESEMKDLIQQINNKWTPPYFTQELSIPFTEKSLQVFEYLKNSETKKSQKAGTVLIPKTPGNFAFIYNLAKENEVICSETGQRIVSGKPIQPALIIHGTEDKITIDMSNEGFKIYSNERGQIWWTMLEDHLHPVHFKNYESLPPEVQIPEDQKGKFLFEVLPEIQSRFGAHLSPELTKYELSKIYPEISLSFDYNNEEIICDTVIKIKDQEICGTRTLDLPMEDFYERSTQNPYLWYGVDQKSLLEYIHFLEENEFVISNGRFIIHKEEDIQNFLTGDYLHLPEDWGIQTTESFDHLEVRPVELEPIIDISTDGKINWFDFQVTYNLGGETFTHQEIMQRLKKNSHGDSYIQIGNQFFVIYNDDKQRLIEDNINLTQKVQNRYQSQFYNLLYYRNLFLEKGIQIHGDRIYNELEEDLTNKQLIQEWKTPKEVKSVLREYQKTGYYWMRFLQKYRFGGILADDMGLGKTIQVLTLLKGVDLNKPSLVVCPRSLLYNWGEEIKKFFPSMKYFVYYGTPTERIESLEQIQGADVVITTYSIIGRDIDLLNDYSFGYLILDEAQQIKNYRTKRAESVKNVRADHLLVLTGTPIENSVEELWSLFDFLMPGYLGSHSDFQKKYLKPIKEENNQKLLEQLKQRVSPFILRRNKREVLTELPDKIEQVSKVAMTKLQEDVYKTILAQVRDDIFKSIQEKGFKRSQISVLSALTKLRQVCNHPKLVMQNLEEEVVSGKVEALMEIVQEAIASGHKLLVFSQFVKMLRIIEDEFHKAEITYEYLDGSTKNRMERVKRFNDDPEISVFLISLKAGGTGLNLTSADMVIHVDPWWNPMVENQATDRAHRIGQENTVTVYKLITSGTVEEKILKLQEKKQNIFDAVIEENSGKVENLTWEDVQELFEF